MDVQRKERRAKRQKLNHCWRNVVRVSTSFNGTAALLRSPD
jgi:hypothetical protein